MQGDINENYSVSIVDLYFQRNEEYDCFEWQKLKENHEIDPKEVLCDGLLCENISNKHKFDLHYYLLTMKGIYIFDVK